MRRYYNNSILPKEYHRIAPTGGFYYSNDLVYSIAYQKLSISSRNFLHAIIHHRNWTGKGKKKKILNNGEISLTEVQFRNMGLGCKATYLRARNQLIENGFIKQTYRGGMCRGDMAKYKLLCIEGVPINEQRWREYPNKNWKKEVPINKDNQIGLKTRFKKGGKV